MPEPIVSAANEVADLLKEAAARGHLVIVRAAPPSHVDPQTPLFVACNRAFGLTAAEARAFIELVGHPHVSRAALHTAIGGEGKIKGVDVVICRLRKKLGPHGIEIVTVWGQGFRLVDGARDRIRKILADAGLDLTSLARIEPDQLAG
jgi:Transcriptional regulatory protein, C terminal